MVSHTCDEQQTHTCFWPSMEHLYLSSSLTLMFSSHTMEGLSLSLMTSSFNVNFVVPPVGHVPLMC